MQDLYVDVKNKDPNKNWALRFEDILGYILTYRYKELEDYDSMCKLVSSLKNYRRQIKHQYCNRCIRDQKNRQKEKRICFRVDVNETKKRVKINKELVRTNGIPWKLPAFISYTKEGYFRNCHNCRIHKLKEAYTFWIYHSYWTRYIRQKNGLNRK